MLILFATLLFMMIGSFQAVQNWYEWTLFLSIFGVISLTFLKAIKKDQLPKETQRTALLEAIHEGAILIDGSGDVLEINHLAKKSLGLETLHSLFDIKEHSPLLRACMKAAKNAVEKGQVSTINFPLNQERKTSIDVVAKPLKRTGTFLILLCDRSFHHQMEQVGKDFVANASHELRTPITIIKGFAETMRDLPEMSEAMFDDFVEKIVRNCSRMESLVKNLLTLNDLDYLPKAKLQECDLVGLLDNCVHTLLSVHHDVEVETLHNSDIITVEGDPDLLELAFMNILENGVKYSRSPAKLGIKIEELPNEVNLTISDQGIGIPSSDIDHVFDRFYTVNKSHSRKLGGAGLGLSIVKGIIKKHDAVISVSSQENKGTSFLINFQKEALPTP